MKNIPNSRPAEILVVEDSPSDALITQEALSYAKVLNNLHIVENGIEAMEFLYKQGRYADAPTPDLILLDLNLPKMDGREVLAQIKAHENLKRIPVVVLTTSRAEEDVLQAYGLHANCFITKPVDFNSFAEIVKGIEHFWFSIVTLPPAG